MTTTSKQSTKKRKYVSSPIAAVKNATPSTVTIDQSLHQMKFIIEDFTDRKSQLSINAYDIIDQHIRVVDEEIKLLETAIRLSGAEVPLAPTSSEMEDMYTNSGSSSGSKRKNNMTKQKLKKRQGGTCGDEDEEISSEPIYCLCQRTNYGDMIRCDSDDCAIEWFHYPCVGLTKEPSKRWLCPDCKVRQLK